MFSKRILSEGKQLFHLRIVDIKDFNGSCCFIMNIADCVEPNIKNQSIKKKMLMCYAYF